MRLNEVIPNEPGEFTGEGKSFQQMVLRNWAATCKRMKVEHFHNLHELIKNGIRDLCGYLKS